VWGRGQNLRRRLVSAELALALMLLVGAGLLVRSFAKLQQVPPGFNPNNTLTLELTLTGRKYADPQVAVETYRRLWERLAGLPGVASAGSVSALPLSQMFAWGPISVEGRPLAPGEQFINADIRIVSGDYFRTMEIPLVKGRFFDERDTRTSMRVVIIDQHMAEELWPGEDAVGKRIRGGGADSTAPWITVVGVVGRVRQYALDSDSRIATYHPHTQYAVRGMNVVVRSHGDPAALTGAVRAAIHAIDPDVPIYGVRTMEQRVSDSLATRRFSMLLLTLFAVLALGLAMIGLYGVMAYLVGQGVRELGIRLALGASPTALLLMIVRQGVVVALTGVGIGLAGALALTRFMRGLLYGVDPLDPATFTAIAALLTMTAIGASYLPARRAAHIDPAVSLKNE
jgi:predicted permease